MAQLNLAASALDVPTVEFGGEEFYPEFPIKVAVLCSHLIRNHPLPAGNKRVGFLCTVEFVERNAYVWESPVGDEPGGEETVKVIERVAADEMPVHDPAEWSINGLRSATKGLDPGPAASGRPVAAALVACIGANHLQTNHADLGGTGQDGPRRHEAWTGRHRTAPDGPDDTRPPDS